MGGQRRDGRTVGAVVLLIAGAVFASACTFELSHPGVTVTCAPLRYEVNTNNVSLSNAQRTAIDVAVVEFADLVGRDVEALGPTDAGGAEVGPDDPILFELTWPSDAPSGLGYAEPLVIENRYSGGWIMLNPMVRHLPAGVLRRLILHELGHLHGLADVDAGDEVMNPALTTDQWGAGDVTGLMLSSAGGCEGAALRTELVAAIG